VVTVDGSVLQSMNVKMEFVKAQKLSPTIYTNGSLFTDERKEFALTTKFDGWIEKLYVNFTGQEVKNGQKLVEIYSPKLVAAQQELLTAVNYEASVNSSSKGELIENAKRKLELFDISKADIEQIIKSKKTNKYMTLYAPFNGTVLSKNVLEGEMVKAGKEIIKIADLSNLWLKADIYESELNKIDIGSVAEVQFNFNSQKTYKGKISFIYPTIDAKTRTASVRIDIKNDGNLKPSMFGNVILKGKDLGEVLTIPETAVLRSGKRNIVILSLGDGKFKPVEVTLGLYSDGLYEVLSGLKLNDAFVSSGQFMIDSESSLRSAVNLFTSDNTSKEPEKVMSDEEMKDINKSDLKKMEKMESVPKEETHTEEDKHETSIVHKGIIDVEAIDKNKDGKVFQDPMDWNVISDEEGRCPLCGMFLKEVTIDEAKMNLKMNGFEYK
jgi:Cu(I)/Ag(I) efflux system membrane fusion protein/cobalt-zinc-cadmium efflux system membrane fusion protein